MVEEVATFAVSAKAVWGCSDSKRRNHVSSMTKLRGLRKKAENRLCRSRELVKKAGSMKKEKWRWMKTANIGSTFAMCSKKNGNRSCKILCNDGMISCQSTNIYRKRSHKLQSLQDNKMQCQKNLGKWVEHSDQLRMISTKGMQRWKSWVKKIQKASMAEVELDE